MLLLLLQALEFLHSAALLPAGGAGASAAGLAAVRQGCSAAAVTLTRAAGTLC